MTSAAFIMPADDRTAFLDHLRARLSKLPARKWAISVEPYVKRRSADQNALLWKLYTEVLEHGGETLRGWSKEDIHEYCLGECFGWERLEGFGRARLKPKHRSSKLNVQEFADYLEFICRRMAEHGIVLALPGEAA